LGLITSSIGVFINPEHNQCCMTLTAAELFAGVGGFRLGLEGRPGSRKKGPFRVIWANQWEPSSNRQHAAEIYANRWNLEEELQDSRVFSNGSNEVLTNINIEEVSSSQIPAHDLLCGGFPCQDYSVARTRSGEMGIKGEKGKLWTSIRRIIDEAEPKPRIVLLENVPRLLNSPAAHRGLNFTVILNDLLDLGYDVEWRVINAADYGFPQKRKRVFIIAYLRGLVPTPVTPGEIKQWLGSDGPFAESFPITGKSPREKIKIILEPNPRNKSPYKNTGYAWVDEGNNHYMLTAKTKADYAGKNQKLGDVVETLHNPDYEVVDKEKLRKYRYIKGEQKEWRIRKADMDIALAIDAGNGMNLWEYYQVLTKEYDSNSWTRSRNSSGYKLGVESGIIYNYTAGKMAFPDSLSNPSRTVVTAEIGKSVSRMRHVIEYEPGKYRRLMPVELERLNGFPPDWTKLEGTSDSRRGFLMGNALVVGIIQRLAPYIATLLHNGVDT